MRRSISRAAVMALALCVPFAESHAQTMMQKSRSSGFFMGLGLEGSDMNTNQSGSTVTESGGGAGLILGYGFNRTWALYGDLSGATMNANGGGTYSLGHFDIGTRIHFRTGPNTVVPFLQVGLSGRGVSQTVNGSTFTANGGGLSFGGGLNAHFSPAVALSTALTWSVGNFSNFAIDNSAISNGSVSATSARLHIGLIWFPQS